VFPTVYIYMFEGLCCVSLWNCYFHNVFRLFTNMCSNVMLFGFMELSTSYCVSDGLHVCV